MLACKTVVNYDISVVLPDEKTTGILTEGVKRPISTDGEQGFGIAIDIGTTTIAAQLIQLSTGAALKTVSQLNKQKKYGSDVMSRLHKGTKPLNQCIIEQLNDIIDTIKGEHDIKRVFLTGNTAMLHFVQAFDTRALAVAPYQPYNTAMNTYSADDLGLNGKFQVITAPCIAGFVGGDTVCAILACSMDVSNKTSLLIDIGTNGEMVLKHKNKLVCCSTAAGPAFEGAQIKHGTGSVEGAISSVLIDSGIHIKTIGDKKPIGICGSGIIDAAAQMVANKIIDETGFLDMDFLLADDIYIVQKDIREIQLAKSAIRSGIDTLVEETGIQYNEIDNVFLAGGMGSFINLESAAEIKLLPLQLIDKTSVSGNAALGGAIAMLVSEKIRTAAELIAKTTQHIELSSSSLFNDAFVSNLLF
ncbi:MAG: ATP-binding protein [Clostridiaceae bacterium]|nr:ATP-binding protein [Clostridiaceae bacterium]